MSYKKRKREGPIDEYLQKMVEKSNHKEIKRIIMESHGKTIRSA